MMIERIQRDNSTPLADPESVKRDTVTADAVDPAGDKRSRDQKRQQKLGAEIEREETPEGTQALKGSDGGKSFLLDVVA